MSAVVNNPQRQTYQEKASETWAHFSTDETRLGLLSKVVDLTTKPFDERAKTLLGEKQLAPLKEFIRAGYDAYENTVKEKTVAVEALKKFQEAIVYLTPGNVQRTPALEIHWVKLGVEETYRKSEEEFTTARGKLTAKAEELNALIVKTHGFLKNLQQLLGNTAYEVTVLEKTTPFGGSAWSAEYYFNEGLKAYRKSLEESSVATTATEAIATSSLKDGVNETKKAETSKVETPKNAQVAVA